MPSGNWKSVFLCLLGCLAIATADANNSGTIAADEPLGCVAGSGLWGAGPPSDLEYWSDVSEELLLVGAGAELVLFDIDIPTTPVELGRVTVDHPVTSISISADGSMASVSDWFDNVTLVDISNRSMPAKRGTYAWAGLQQPTGMAFDGDYLFVAVRTVGLTVLDISDPDTPTFVANSGGTVSDFVFDVALRGNYAYLGQSDDGVQIVDISNPASPSVVGNHAASVGAGQITIDGARAYVATGSAGFDILDLTNATSPSLLGSYDATGFAFEVQVMPGDQVALADSIDGTVVLDISTPATPTPLGDFGFTAFRIAPLGDEVFVSMGPEFTPRVRLVDFQAPATPSEIGHIDFDGLSMAVSVGVDHILVANNEGGVVMLDTTNPIEPTEVGRVDITIDARKVAHVNGYGVASPGYASEIGVIEILPGGPVLETIINNSFPTNDLVGDGNFLYVASGEFGGLRIHDMSDPTMPQFEGSVVPAGEVVWQIAVAGSWLYSGYVNDTDLLVIDVSNPASPATVGSGFVLPGGAVDIAASGNHIYVGTDLHGVRILQNDGAGNISEIADIDVAPASVTGVAVEGNLLYISAGVFSGLLVYDVSDPSDPQFVEQHNTAGEGSAVDVLGQVVAMAERKMGVSTFGCDPEASNDPPVPVGTISDQENDEGETIFPLSTNPNFDDPDGQALSFSATGLPPGLDITEGSGVIEGSLGYDTSGVYSVEVTATDPFGLFATQAFTWTINEANAPPISISEIPDQTNEEGDSVNFDVSPHFEEPDGDPLRFEAGNLPAGLEIDENTGIISGTIQLGAEGFYPVLIVVYDPENESTGQTFNWTIDEIDTSIFRSGFE